MKFPFKSKLSDRRLKSLGVVLLLGKRIICPPLKRYSLKSLFSWLAIIEGWLIIRLFLNKQMYNHKKIKNKTNKYKRILESLYKLYITKKINIPNKWLNETYKGIKVNNKQIIIDYISGMTDRYILKIYSNLKK